MPLHASAIRREVHEPLFGVLANASEAMFAATSAGHLRGPLETTLPPTLAAYVLTCVIVMLCLAIIASSARSALLIEKPGAPEMQDDAACEEGRVFCGSEARPLLILPQIVVHEWSEGAALRPVRRSRSTAVSPV